VRLSSLPLVLAGPISEMEQLRRIDAAESNSGLPEKAGIFSAGRHVLEVPRAIVEDREQALIKSHLHQHRSGFSSAVCLVRVLLGGVFRMT
jgi:hypothetical protein